MDKPKQKGGINKSLWEKIKESASGLFLSLAGFLVFGLDGLFGF
jgi:hypothetical protein